MTLGIAFLILFLPVIAYFIADNFTVILGLFNNAVSYLSSVPAVAGGLWSVLPSYLTGFIIAVLTITLTFNLLRRII